MVIRWPYVLEVAQGLSIVTSQPPDFFTSSGSRFKCLQFWAFEFLQVESLEMLDFCLHVIYFSFVPSNIQGRLDMISILS